MPTGLQEHGLTNAPKLVVGDSAIGFWAARSKIYPETDHQRCWVYKTANELNKLPKSRTPKVNLHDIWMAETTTKRWKRIKGFNKLELEAAVSTS